VVERGLGFLGVFGEMKYLFFIASEVEKVVKAWRCFMS
jgi:hypothetical protein